MSDAGLTVILPTYARAEILRLTLLGLCDQIDRKSLSEVIVVSDGSDIPTELVVRSFSERLPLVYLEQPKQGVSSARNRGISIAKCAVVLLLDDDVVPGPELVGEHMRFHEENVEKENVLLGYVTWHPGLHISPFMRWYGEYGALFGFGLLKENRPVDPRYFYSCNISLKREFLLAHGSFNTELTVLEDNELGYRLARDGMRLIFRKAARGQHFQTFTFKQSCERLERYSSGLNAFLATPAGKVLARRRRSLQFQALEAMVRIVAPLLRPLMPLVDCNMKMPNAFYRLFYWYYGSYKSFWSTADWRLMHGE